MGSINIGREHKESTCQVLVHSPSACVGLCVIVDEVCDICFLFQNPKRDKPYYTFSTGPFLHIRSLCLAVSDFYIYAVPLLQFSNGLRAK